MNNQNVTSSSGSSDKVAVVHIQSTSKERITFTICATIVVSLIVGALIVALCFANHNGEDYVSALLPVVSGSVFGLIGFGAGLKMSKRGE